MMRLQLFCLFFQATISGAIAVQMLVFNKINCIFKGQGFLGQDKFKDLFGILQGQHGSLGDQVISEGDQK